MLKGHSFKFLDVDLHRELVDLLKRGEIEHHVDDHGVLHYSIDDREAVENELICSIRDRVFPSWQVLTCPDDWIAHYKDYMSRHEIPFTEELSDGEAWFLLPRKYRPHSWKLEVLGKKERLARSRGR